MQTSLHLEVFAHLQAEHEDYGRDAAGISLDPEAEMQV